MRSECASVCLQAEVPQQALDLAVAELGAHRDGVARLAHVVEPLFQLLARPLEQLHDAVAVAKLGALLVAHLAEAFAHLGHHGVLGLLLLLEGLGLAALHGPVRLHHGLRAVVDAVQGLAELVVVELAARVRVADAEQRARLKKSIENTDCTYRQRN